MVDLDEFKATQWTFLTNVKMKWRYDGMAYVFREAGIPLYGIDLGSMKMNHPVLTLAVPTSRDKNYGVNIYVPVDRKKEASKLISDEKKLGEYAELEEVEGPAHHKDFNEQARAALDAAADARKKDSGLRSALRRVFPSASRSAAS